MYLAILSDIHDNIWNLQKALAMPTLQGTDAILCCGDLCSPFVINLLGQGYKKDIHIVLGNNEGDIAAIIRNAAKFTNIHIHGEYFRGEFGGKTFAMNHYPEKSQVLAESGSYDVVCYGHNHEMEKGKQIGKTLLLNPGAIMGYNGARLKDIDATFLVLNTENLKVQDFIIQP